MLASYLDASVVRPATGQIWCLQLQESLEAIAVASMPHTKGRGGGTAQEMRVPRPEV